MTVTFMEKWENVKGYEKYYEVSNQGRVKSKRTNRILSQTIRGRGYWGVALNIDGKQKQVYVHRLVAEAFIENKDNLPCVNHRDEDKNNNRVGNLEWCSYSYNNNYGTRLSRIAEKLRGSKASEITRKKMSLMRSGKPKKGKSVLCIETKETFKSAREASRKLNLANGTIADVCRGKIKTAGGFHWEYI